MNKHNRKRNREKKEISDFCQQPTKQDKRREEGNQQHVSKRDVRREPLLEILSRVEYQS